MSVATASFFNQAVAIPNTVLFNVPVDGVYQLSIYLACTTVSAGTDSVVVGVFWTDWNGAQEDEPVTVGLTIPDQAQVTLCLFCRAGSQVLFSAPFTGVHLGAAFSLRLVLCRLS